MKNKKNTCIVLFAIAFAGIEIALYFVHPLAPAVVFVSVLMQLPIIFLLFKAKTNGSYEERAAKRKVEYTVEKNAEKWLQKEESETTSLGYKYWSTAGKSLCALNRAEILVLLKKNNQAADLLAQVRAEKLSVENQERFFAIEKQLQEKLAQDVTENISDEKALVSTMTKGENENVYV